MTWDSIISGIIAGLFTGGGLTTILFFVENKRKKQLENETSAAELYEKSNELIVKKDAKIDSLYKVINRQRDENNSLKTQRAVMAVYKCERIDCDKRIPPLGKRRCKDGYCNIEEGDQSSESSATESENLDEESSKSN